MHCPVSCDACDSSPTPAPNADEGCEDSEGKITVNIKGTDKQKLCSFFSTGKGSKYCNEDAVASFCPLTCDACDDDDPPTPPPTVAPTPSTGTPCQDVEGKIRITINGKEKNKPCSFWSNPKKGWCTTVMEVRTNCPESCDSCDPLDPTPSPTVSPSVAPTPSTGTPCQDTEGLVRIVINGKAKNKLCSQWAKPTKDWCSTVEEVRNKCPASCQACPKGPTVAPTSAPTPSSNPSTLLHSTLNSVSHITTPNVGIVGGETSLTSGDFVAGIKYKGAQFSDGDGSGKYIRFQAGVKQDGILTRQISLQAGSVSFYYKPSYASATNDIEHALIVVGDYYNAPKFALIEGDTLKLRIQESWSQSWETAASWRADLWDANEWIFVQATWNTASSSNSMKIFVNGDRVDEDNVSGGWDLDKEDEYGYIYVGSANSDGAFASHGIIDDITISSDRSKITSFDTQRSVVEREKESIF